MQVDRNTTEVFPEDTYKWCTCLDTLVVDADFESHHYYGSLSISGFGKWDKSVFDLF